LGAIRMPDSSWIYITKLLLGSALYLFRITNSSWPIVRAPGGRSPFFGVEVGILIMRPVIMAVFEHDCGEIRLGERRVFKLVVLLAEW